jgi:hypothetical protein
LVLSLAADNRVANSIIHTEEDQRPTGGVVYGHSMNDARLQSFKTGQPKNSKYKVRQDFERKAVRDLSAEALRSGEYSSISSTTKQTLHLNKLKSIYRSGPNNHSVSSQSRLSSNVTAPFAGQVVNNVIYQTNAGVSKGAYSSKV